MGNIKDVLIFGTGRYFENRKYIFKTYKYINIVGFLDNDANKIGTSIENKIIMLPNQVACLEYDAIIIMSSFQNEMIKQLLSMGVLKDKIFVFEEICLLDDVYLYNRELVRKYINNSCSNVIPMFSHELSITGAPIVLLKLAQAFKNASLLPVIISPCDGDLRIDIQNSGIPVIINICSGERNDFISKLNDISKFIVLNTLQTYNEIEFIKNDKQVFWWLHEAKKLYTDDIIEYLYKPLPSNMKVLAVSDVAKDNFIQYATKQQVEILHFGVDDCRTISNESNKKSKLIFAIIGAINEIKGHDLLIKAIDLLDESDKNSIEIWFVGKVFDDKYNNDLKTNACEKVVFKGLITPGELANMYKDIDVVISCSREETLSAVIIEGLMNGKACILPSNLGVAKYIEDKFNGIKYDSAMDYGAIKDEICWVINNQDKLKVIEVNARNTYEKYFAIEIFEERVKEIFGV